MHEFSRRDFLLRSALYGGAFWAAVNVPRSRALAAAAASDTPVVLTAEEWKTVEAITGRIIPADQEPGAVEAGCVNFIDKALAHEDAALRPLYSAGLAGIDAVARARFGRRFADLQASDQDEVLRALASDAPEAWPKSTVPAAEFFEAVRMHTVCGFLADPGYGGNRDFAGWKVVGYPGPHHHHGGYTRTQMIGQEKIVPAWEMHKK